MYLYLLMKDAYIYGKMVNFGNSGNIIKVSEKVDKPTLTTDLATIFHSLFEKEFLVSIECVLLLFKTVITAKVYHP